MKVSLGIDPDLHNTGLALVSPDRVLAVGVVRVPLKLKGDAAVARMSRVLGEYLPEWLSRLQGHVEFTPAALDAVVVEGQQIYIGHGDANPDSILRLAQVTGAALCVAQTACSPGLAVVPRPGKWKGSVPKHIHQRRILTRFGWKGTLKGSGKDRWVSPTNLGPTPMMLPVEWPVGCWKHIVDAMGLARYGQQLMGEVEK